MIIHRSAVVHITIAAPPSHVELFLRDVGNWHTWAPWVVSVERTSDRDWRVQSDVGPMRLRFVEPNAFGVLDHVVVLESGAAMSNALRVVPNGDGTELVMIVLQGRDSSPEEFERDVASVRADFVRLKKVAEGLRELREV